MKQNEELKLNYSSLDLILFAWKNKIKLIVIGIVAAVISLIVSYQIDPLFKSEVVMFSTPSTSASKYLFSQNFVSRFGILSFGEEEHVESLLQILSSNQIRDYIIDKYDLMKHYDVDTSHKYKQTLLYEQYDGNVSFRRTKYLSVVISVSDKNPQMAADIANAIAEKVDEIYHNVQRERATVAVQMVQTQKDSLQAKIDFLVDSMAVLNKQGMFHYETQTERLSEAYAYALKEGNVAGANRVKNEMNRLAQYSAAYIAVRDEANYYKNLMGNINQRLAEAHAEASLIIPQKYIVDKAKPSDKKFYPKKSVIILSTMVVAVILTYILLLIADAIRKYNTQTGA
ncbi:MAG: hypothetical protein MI922_18550 [Bacteroidales bacterium]|nr:hypothetical protein [Bacteroidales bacterium]